jgi:hypothetical protein
MKAYKFVTIIQEGGIIKIPELKDLSGNEIEVFIVEKGKSDYDEEEHNNFEEFSKKWRGALKGGDISHWRDEYIKYKKEKHQ